MKRAPPTVPGEETDTPRARLHVLLREGPATARELSERARLSEKDVLFHLEHLVRSSAARGEPLEIVPARCLGCGFVFVTRERLAKPGRCPECRGTRVAPPRFAIATR